MSSHVQRPTEGSDAPTLDQFLILSRKVEELEDRVRSLAVNDVDPLRSRVAAQQETITKMKSPRSWARALWRRARRAFGQ